MLAPHEPSRRAWGTVTYSVGCDRCEVIATGMNSSAWTTNQRVRIRMCGCWAVDKAAHIFTSALRRP